MTEKKESIKINFLLISRMKINELILKNFY